MPSIDTTSGGASRTASVPSATASTIIVGVYLPTVSGAADWVLLSLDDGASQFLQIARDSTGGTAHVACWSDQHNGGASGLQLFTEASAVGEWFWIAMVGIPAVSSVFWKLQGGSVQTATIASSVGTPTLMGIANDGFGTGSWPGEVGVVKAWNASLSAAEVALELNNIAAIRRNNLTFYNAWDNAPTATLDQSQSLANLTASGTLALNPKSPIGKLVGNTNRIASKFSSQAAASNALFFGAGTTQ